ncbi:MAG: FAD-binding oxidoreductase [Candidatus Bathyarchaeota archaeon]|nr:MAG: FAD-binding oxidoreductase [Candidatus Bathyarchaeota archaeon]
MSPGPDGRTSSQLVEKLAEIVGRDRLLTEPEDRYVYSFTGEFATQRRKQPIAVVRPRTEDEGRELARLIESYGARAAWNDVLEDVPEDEDSQVVLLDRDDWVTARNLSAILSELEKEKGEGKGRLRSSSNFPDWFVTNLKSRDGYRIGERPGADDGFCTVQSYFDGVETYSSKGRLILTRGLMADEIEASYRLVDSIYSCTTCGQCYDQLSLMGLEMNNVIVLARREVASRGIEPGHCRIVSGQILADGNPMGMPAEDRSLWYEEAAEEHPFEGNEVLYWTGCSTSYRLPEVVEATTSVLAEAGVDFGLLGEEEGCCGLVLYLMGLWDEAKGNAEQAVAKFRERGVKTLVTGCAGCLYAFKRVYAMLDVPLHVNVLHTSQLIEALVKEGRLRLKESSGRYVWHDPCDLGRHCKIYDPPRNVLKSIPGLELVEPSLSREHALCCGAGGGLMAYDADLSKRIAVSKLKDEIVPMKVEGIVTGCPACIINLRYALEPQEVPVYDLAQLVEMSL